MLTTSARAGQASVELVVVLPVLVLILAAAYQALVAGHAVWQVRVAARAAARAQAVGSDPAAAARAHLPPALEPDLRVDLPGAGDVRVAVRVPAVLPGLALGHVAATSHFRSQDR